MRKQIIPDAKTAAEARQAVFQFVEQELSGPPHFAKAAPWAAKVVKVEGGYMAFESVTDYETWKRQK